MDFDDQPRRAPTENIVPMINVVFLLLIFFLMTATIAPPEPFEVGLPASTTDTAAEVDLALYVSAEGTYAFDGKQGDAALAELVGSGVGRQDGPPLIIRADRDLPGKNIAALLNRLLALGITSSQLVAEARR